MLNNILKTLGIIASASVLVLVIAIIARQASQETSLSSVERSSEYQATSTLNATAAGEYTIFTGVGTLGSIVIVSSTPAVGFAVYDAGIVSSTPTTTLAIFNASPVVGTYTFDRVVTRGLRLVVPSGFNGQIITTYRNQQ